MRSIFLAGQGNPSFAGSELTVPMPLPASKLISHTDVIRTFVNQEPVALDKSAVNKLVLRIQAECARKPEEKVDPLSFDELLAPILLMVATKLLPLHEDCLSGVPAQLPAVVSGKQRDFHRNLPFVDPLTLLSRQDTFLSIQRRWRTRRL